MPGRPPSAAQAPLASFLQASRSGGIGAKQGPPTFNPAMVSPQNQLNVLAGLTRCSATFQRQATQVAVTVLKVRQRRELGIPAAPGTKVPRTRARARNRAGRGRKLDAEPFRRRTARCPWALVLKPVASTPELPSGRSGAATRVRAHVSPPIKAPLTQRAGRRGSARSPTLGRRRLHGAPVLSPKGLRGPPPWVPGTWPGF